jgi:single-strand DNA-binding protein
MGRLTADPELKYTSNNIAVCSFCVAVERSFVKEGEERQTDFINCVAWRQKAEFLTKYFKKGNMVALNGAIQTRNYEDKDGNKRTAVEIQADHISFCGSKSETVSGTQTPPTAQTTEIPQQSTADAIGIIIDDDDDLGEAPF